MFDKTSGFCVNFNLYLHLKGYRSVKLNVKINKIKRKADLLIG